MPIGINSYIRVNITWMVHLDMPDVLAVEAANSYYRWTEEDYAAATRAREVIGMVAHHGDRAVGAMLYRLGRGRIDLIRFGVHPAFHRQGVGHQMMARLKGKLSSGGRTRIAIDVRETALPMQVFLRHEGFLWTATFPEAFQDSGEDGYRFVHEIPASDVTPDPLAGWPLD